MEDESETKGTKMDVEQGMGADGLGPSSAPHVQQMEQFKEEMSREPPPYEPGFAPHAAPGDKFY